MFFTSKKNIPDAEIMTGICGGLQEKRNAENLLFEKYYYLIKEGIRKHRLSEDECVSIYSDTVIAIIDSIMKQKFEGRSELKTYIFQIFSNKCVDQIRKNTTNKASVHQALALDLDLPLPDESKNIIQKMMLKSEIEQLYQKLSLIGEKCKKIILLWGESFTDEEISIELGYNTAAVAKTSRLRCLEKLRELC